MKQIFICILVFFTIYSIQLHSQDLKDYLIAYWSFDDSTARDNSGNGYHGTLVNFPKPDIGIRGSCFRFKGKNKYIQTFDNKSLIGDYITVPRIPFENHSEFTIMCWVNKEKFDYWGGTAYVFFGEIIKAWTGIYHAGKYPDPTSWVKFASGSIDDLDEPIKYDYQSSDDNKWKHYTLVYKNKQIYAYVDGKLIASKYQPHLTLNGNGGIATHWWYYDGEHRMTAGFTGRIDEVKIFKKALTQEEIENEYGNCIPWVSFNDFSTTYGLTFNGSAKSKDNSILLSKSIENESGSLWYNIKLPINASFTNEFSFKFTEGNNGKYDDGSLPGADGIAFVIQNHSINALGWDGGYMGYTGIKDAVAFEFDTYHNKSDEINDPNGNHAAINISDHNGILRARHSFENTLALNDSLTVLKENIIYYSKIKYNFGKKEIQVYLDEQKPAQKLILKIENFDLPKLVNSNDYAIMGFTSSTGVAFANHSLLSWEMCFNNLLPTSIFDESYDNLKLSVFPNPTSDIITMKFENTTENLISIQIYNLLGILEKEFKINEFLIEQDRILINIADLSAGNYLIRINSENACKIHKVVKY